MLYLLCAEAKLITENFRRGRRCSADSTEGGPLGEIYAGVCSEHVSFFFVFCPTGKLKTPRALSDFFFSSSSSFVFLFFFCMTPTQLSCCPPPIPPPSLILLFMQSLLHFTDHFSQREREVKKQKKRCLLTFYPLLTLTERDSEMDFDRRGLLRNGESRSEV